ncbi:hypothetical protein ACH4FE_23850 [Streptomyces celluloflavus]|uniref:hypothetical protein n=1 Tax=Streptomyces celluloflavus TaxID=58344 RepID=UPI00379E9B7B
MLRARRMLVVGAIGATTAVAGATTFAVAQAAPKPAGASVVQQAAAGELPPPAVEDFEYPGAEKIFKERGIKLIKGDGHILLAECSQARDIVLERRWDDDPTDYQICFRVTGKKGVLSLSIPETFNVKAGDQAVRATLTADGKTQVVDVPKNTRKTVGEGVNPDAPQTTLVELRVG